MVDFDDVLALFRTFSGDVSLPHLPAPTLGACLALVGGMWAAVKVGGLAGRLAWWLAKGAGRGALAVLRGPRPEPLCRAILADIQDAGSSGERGALRMLQGEHFQLTWRDREGCSLAPELLVSLVATGPCGNDSLELVEPCQDLLTGRDSKRVLCAAQKRWAVVREENRREAQANLVDLLDAEAHTSFWALRLQADQGNAGADEGMV